MQTMILSLLNNPMGNAAVQGAQGMMRGGPGGHGGPGGFFLGGLGSILWTVVIVLAVLWVTRNWDKIKGYASRTASSFQGGSAVVAQAPLEILQTRYAKGEITREEYETIRRDLVGEPAPVAAPAPEPVGPQA